MEGAAAVPGWLQRAAFFSLMAVAVVLRVYALGRLPGINGDEAWCGVLAQRVGHANPAGWLTSSGNLPAPFHLGLLALFARVAPPSFALLRVPTVLASFAQLALTFAVARRHFGRGVAVAATILTASLPIVIAYARFGWDPSYQGVVAVAALHYALRRRFAPVLALFALGVWIHPTAVFVAPLLIVCFAFAAEGDGWRRAARPLALLAGAAGALTLAVALLKGLGPAADPRFAGVLSRLWDPRQAARFALAFARLLDGDTAFTYIAGAGYGAASRPIAAATLVLVGAVIALGARGLAGEPRRLGVVVGWLATLAVFYVLAGEAALRPHLERYGVCLVAPTIFSLAILGARAAERLRAPVIFGGGLTLVAAALLCAFWRCYIVALETTGSTSHPAFWTGPVEPKAEAFRRIEEASPAGARVVAEGWWLYWPLAYLAHGTRVQVDELEDDALEHTPPLADAYFVGFPGDRVERRVKASGAARLLWEIPGAGGRVVLRVWKSPGAAP